MASLAIKEGSIGSLLVKIPWKDRGCTVEVDELELVLVPSKRNYFPVVADNLHFENDEEMSHDSANLDHDMRNNTSKSMPGDIHEGVKTVAKMVKLFLTSFNVKLKKLIIAFEPHSESHGDKSALHRTFVLRISEIECGTCVSDDGNTKPEVKDESFLGISRLTNFVKFEGVALELLQLDDCDDKTCVQSMSSSVAIPIMTGKGGGFSGNLKLSIPWKNGSLDIRRVDSNVSIDPIQIQLQPSTIKWILHSWEGFKQLEKDVSDSFPNKAMDLAHLTSRPISAAISTINKIPACDAKPNDLSSPAGQESSDVTRLSGPHLISDWVPSQIYKNKNAGIEEELEARLIFIFRFQLPL